jgi:hypothetical protein
VPQTEITHPTATKTFMPECNAPLQILRPLVTFRYSSDISMWRYGITGITHVAANHVKARARIDSSATSREKFSPERYMHYTSDTVAPHAAITGIAYVALCCTTISLWLLY